MPAVDTAVTRVHEVDVLKGPLFSAADLRAALGASSVGAGVDDGDGALSLQVCWAPRLAEGHDVRGLDIRP